MSDWADTCLYMFGCTNINLPSSRLSTSISTSESSRGSLEVAENEGQGASCAGNSAVARLLQGLDLAATFGAEWEVLGSDEDRRPTFSRGSDVRVTLGATPFSRHL